jgi:hypothetical protein
MGTFTDEERAAIAEAEAAGKVRAFPPGCALGGGDSPDPQRQRAARRAAAVSAEVRRYRAGPSSPPSNAGDEGAVLYR